MSRTLLIIGYGKGIGRRLVQSLDGFPQFIAVSRSQNEAFENVQHIQCDVENFPAHVKEIKSKIAMIVYVASEFGESGEMSTGEFDKFMETGPRGTLAVFHALKRANLLENKAMFIGIGSTASERVSAKQYLHPIYSIAKLTQKTILASLAAQHQNYRFATITLGSIGEDNEDAGVGYGNIVDTVDYLYSLSPSVGYSEVELVAKMDF